MERLQCLIKAEPNALKEIPKAQRKRSGQPLAYYVQTVTNTKNAMKQAYETGDYTMQQIADAFDVHYSTVSRAVNQAKIKND